MPRSRQWHRAWPLALIVLVALALRVALVVATPHYEPAADPTDYIRHAVSIADGHGYPDTVLAKPGTPSALRPPVYPYLLGGVFTLTGRKPDAGRLLGALLGAFTVVLIYLLARAIADRRVAWVAAAIAAVFPPLVMLNGSLLSEQIFLPLELGAVLSVVAYRCERRSIALAVVAGVLCGLAALTRSVGALLLIPIVIGLWDRRGSRRARFVAPIAAVVAAALVIAPWTIRNAITFHDFVPISTQGGPTAVGMYNEESYGPGAGHAVWRPPNSIRSQLALRRSLDEADLNTRLTALSRRFALNHPGYVVTSSIRNALRFIDIGPAHTRVTRTFYFEMGVPDGTWRLTSASVWLLLALALPGAILVLRRGRPHRFVWIAPILMFVSVIPIQGGERFRAPIDPFLVVMAAVAIASFAPASRLLPRSLRPPRHDGRAHGG